MIECRTIIDRAEWLEWRKQDVTASVVGALCGVHPYTTALRLYAEKRGTEFEPVKENKFMRKGRKLEPVVVNDVLEQRPDWYVELANEYWRDSVLRLGATPDAYIRCPVNGRGILQIKTAQTHIIARDWHNGEEPPLWILLQTSTEMMLAEANFAAVAVWDDGEAETTIFHIPRNLAVEAKIVLAVREFWKRVETGAEPEPDFGRDRDVIRALRPRAEPGKIIDLRDSNELPGMLAARASRKAEIFAHEEFIKQIDAELMHRIGDAETALVDGFRITYKSVDVKGYTVQPRSSRQLRILDRRAPQDEQRTQI